MVKLMQAFPSPAEGQVTLANWRSAPFSKWGFQHVREIVPSADIPNDPHNVWTLPDGKADFSRLRIDGGSRGPLTLEGYLDATDADGCVVLHRGRVVLAEFRNGMTATTPHILMSVTKSLLGLLAGILEGKGLLDPRQPVTDYVPEVGRTAYRGATVRDLLDMRVGVAFNEDYTATAGAIVTYRKATGWNPLGPGEAPGDLRSFYAQLAETDGPHGGRFHYVSPNTDLLGWVIERATGRRYADLMSEFLWQPLGADRSAYITVDRFGAPRCAGGMCVTVPDLARVGQLMVQGGVRDGRQILPKAFLTSLFADGDPTAWAQGSFVEYYPGLDIHYRSKWYVERGARPSASGLGIHGQYIFVDPAAEVVVAQVSSGAEPIHADNVRLAHRGLRAIRDLLAAR